MLLVTIDFTGTVTKFIHPVPQLRLLHYYMDVWSSLKAPLCFDAAQKSKALKLAPCRLHIMPAPFPGNVYKYENDLCTLQCMTP